MLLLKYCLSVPLTPLPTFLSLFPPSRSPQFIFPVATGESYQHFADVVVDSDAQDVQK